VRRNSVAPTQHSNRAEAAQASKRHRDNDNNHITHRPTPNGSRTYPEPLLETADQLPDALACLLPIVTWGCEGRKRLVGRRKDQGLVWRRRRLEPPVR
jgi:hypothetical protein